MVRQQIRKEGKITGKSPQRTRVTTGKTSWTHHKINTSKHRNKPKRPITVNRVQPRKLVVKVRKVIQPRKSVVMVVKDH